MARHKVSCILFSARVLPTAASSQRNYLNLPSSLPPSLPSFLLLSVEMALDLEKVVFFAPFLRIPLMFMKLFSTARGTYYLSWLKPDKDIQKDFF